MYVHVRTVGDTLVTFTKCLFGFLITKFPSPPLLRVSFLVSVREE